MVSSFALRTLTASELSLATLQSPFSTGQSFPQTFLARFVLLRHP
jgi:hypothetical protein